MRLLSACSAWRGAGWCLQLPDSARSADLLLGEVVFVLVLDAQLLQVIQLLLLDLLDLEALVFQALTYLAALLEVVETLLFLVFLVFGDLTSDLN